MINISLNNDNDNVIINISLNNNNNVIVNISLNNENADNIK